MSYYEKVLQPDEQVRFVGRLHWVIHKNAILFVILALVFGIVALGQANDLRIAAWFAAAGCMALAALSYLGSWFRQITTEFVVTDKRIIHKVGWISRRTQEMNIGKVETVDIRQGIPGRMFDYGTVLIIGIGGSWEPLTGIASPLALRNTIVVG